MTVTERKLLIQTGLIGAFLTVLVTLVHQLELFSALDNFIYDRRVRDCQFFRSPPTDELVHIDVDDLSLGAVGRWPWPRGLMGDLIDEIRRAGAKEIALDIIFPEVSEPEEDERLITAVRHHAGVLIPVSLGLDPEIQSEAVWAQMIDQLEKNPELSSDQLIEILRTQGLNSNDLVQKVDDRFSVARRLAIYHRIESVPDASTRSSVELAKIILPSFDPSLPNSPRYFELVHQHNTLKSIHSLRRFARPVPDNLPAFLPTTLPMPSFPALSDAAAMSGFVDYLHDKDGVVRAIPLFKKHAGWIYPQIGFALACQHLGVDLKDVEIQPNRIVIPKPDGHRVVIPVRRQYVSKVGDVGTIMDVPWFGKTHNWKLMYDPDGKSVKQRLPMLLIWKIHDARQRITHNNAAADQAISVILDDDAEYKLGFNPAQAKAYAANLSALEDTDRRLDMIRQTLADLAESGWVDVCKQALEEGQATGNDRFQCLQLLDAHEALTNVLEQNAKLETELRHIENKVKNALSGRAVLIGWTATGIIADFVPTSLHSRCPGSVVHATIFNAIVTENLWRNVDRSVSSMITVIIGLSVMLATLFLSPLRAMAASLVLGVGYLVLNGVVLFAKFNLLVDAAGPLVTVGLVWSGCTLYRQIRERIERRHITQRFRSYVDPVLVDYVIEHPDQAKLGGQMRELTVVFTDLAGFTTLSEKLRERTVAILNEYMELMVPIIREQNGLVNKFLGDGIMFFYGAPRSNQYHAIDAVSTALKMQESMIGFNRRLTEQGLPEVKMRVGISSGNMVVGDAGSADASDYTVLGDAVNLGARLESANKATGTWIMLNDRAAMLVEDMFLLRPLGRLQVVGKSQGVMTYEPLCLSKEANDDHRKTVGMTNEIVNAFIVGEFEKCIKLARQYEAEHDPSKLTTMYIDISQQYLVDPPGADFLGQIILEEK